MASVPMISVLIPTRGRPQNLKRSIFSLHDSAESPEQVEYLVRFDKDDSSAIFLSSDSPMKIRSISGKRHGYQGLHHYFNELSILAVGEFLMLWNDDTEMLTQGWDRLLHEGPLFSIQNPRRDTVKTTDFTFPVMGRPIYKAMGHFSLNPYNDAYVSHVAFYSGTAIIRDDIEFHHHCLADAQVDEHGSAGIDRFHEPEEVAMRLADIDKVRAAPGYDTRFDGYDIDEVRNYDFKLKYQYHDSDVATAMVCHKGGKP